MSVECHAMDREAQGPAPRWTGRLKHVLTEFRTHMRLKKTRRILDNLPPQIRKDIGWR